MAGILKVDEISEATQNDGVILNNTVKVRLADNSTQTVISTSGNTTTLDNVTLGSSAVPTNNYTFRNKIINGHLKSAKVINQRGASSIAGATGYTYDRWYYDGSTYLYQGIEDANVENGTYVISWEGSGISAAWKVSTDSTANNGPDDTTGFTSVNNGETFTVNETTEFSKHLWIQFSGTLSNLDKVQVERGTVATPFEHRPYGLELSLCQRYYEWGVASGSGYAQITAIFDAGSVSNIDFKVSKRAVPTMTNMSLAANQYPNNQNTNVPRYEGGYNRAFRYTTEHNTAFWNVTTGNGGATGVCGHQIIWNADAEL